MNRTHTKRFYKLLVAALAVNASVCAYAPTTFNRPDNLDFRLYEWPHNNVRVAVAAEYGETHKSRDNNEKSRNVMRRYNETESSIAMLLGSPTDSTIYTVAQNLGVENGPVTDDGYRGNFLLDGHYEETDITPFVRYKLPIHLDGTFELALFVPLKCMHFKNVSWTDLTDNKLVADQQFKADFTSQLAAKAQELGNLNINPTGWKKSGLGDMMLLAGWRRDFNQTKEYLKNVRISAQLGVSMPTGEKKDVDQALALPLGNDGAWGVPLGLGIDLDFIHNLRAGLEFNIFPMFDHDGTYRMKTFPYQTDFLLLSKGRATYSQGTMWEFLLFAQAKNIFKGFSGMITYQFLKHDEDRLYPKSYDFNYNIVNNAESLKEWNMHNLIFEIAVDPFGKDTKDKVKPHLSLFYKLPITGKRLLSVPTIGGQIGMSF